MKADFALDYDVLTVEQPHKLYLMARLTSGPAPDHLRRRPLNLSLVIDRSGSMAGEKIAYVRQAAQFLVHNLGASDSLSVVLYNENVETLVAAEPVTHKDAINQRLNQIRASGMTNLSGGWLQGCTLVAEHMRDDFLNRVILMSDGLANRGITDGHKLVALARQKYEQNVSTTTMGLGADFNEDLLMAMADAGGGAFYFIESPEVAPIIFEEELRGLLSVIGQNLIVTIDVGDEVEQVIQLNAYNMQIQGRSTTFSMGDVFGDEVKTLMLELLIPALHEVGQRQIATLHFEYDEILDSSVQHHVMELPVIVNVAPQAQLPAAPNSEVRRSMLLLKAAQARREAIAAADRGDYAQASQVLKQAAEAINQEAIESEDLQEEQQALERQAHEMERGKDYFDNYNRKTMATQAIYTMTDRHESTQFLRTREIERMLRMPPVEKKPGVPPTHFTYQDKTTPLQADLIRIGRAQQNELILNAKNISRFHCQIKREGSQVVIEDLGSTNGTFVNEVLIKQPHVLSVGDVARIGQETILFHDSPTS
ncbi:MAG: FHA domain-containing protein [Anaerolineae bacterium]|nr:FHA domain-containing protein [Anaerolineae bacterium]